MDISATFSVVQQKPGRLQRHDRPASSRKRNALLLLDHFCFSYIAATRQKAHCNLRYGDDLHTARRQYGCTYHGIDIDEFTQIPYRILYKFIDLLG